MVLDIVATNFNGELLEARVTAPIHSEDGVESDHKTVYARMKMPRVPNYFFLLCGSEAPGGNGAEFI